MAKRPTPPRKRHRPPALGARELLFASLIWRRGRTSRNELHRLTRTHPTLTGTAVARLVEAGVLREGDPIPSAGRGRPQVPLEVDLERRSVVGLAIGPGSIAIARADLRGKLRGDELSRPVPKRGDPVAAAAEMLAEALGDDALSIGLSITGLAVPREHRVLFSSSIGGASPSSLEPIYEVAGDVPVVLDNDMHALALRWLLGNAMPAGDALIVGVDDGRLGASLLLRGCPHAGAVSAANELGHSRLAVETDPCYCGQSGCLERIFSTPQLSRLGAASGRPLADVIAHPRGDRRALDATLDLLITGVANAVNFVLPERLVITSPLARHATFTDAFRDRLPARVLPGLRERVELSFWEQPGVQSAETAAWLALADLFGPAHVDGQIH